MPGNGRTANSQRAERSRIDKRRGGQSDDHQNQRSLDQNTDRNSRPKHREQTETRWRLVAARRQIDARQDAHGENDGKEQDGVGLGEPRLDAENGRGRHHQG